MSYAILAIEAPQSEDQGHSSKLVGPAPDECSIEDVLYHLYVLKTVDRGLDDIDAGRTLPHEQVSEEMRQKWVLGSAG